MRVALALAGGGSSRPAASDRDFSKLIFRSKLIWALLMISSLASGLSLHSRGDKVAFDELEKYFSKSLGTSAYYINLPIPENA